MVQLIALDLDGTLLNSERKLSEENRAAIRLAREKGILIAIATGSPYGLLPYKELEEADISYAITANGSGIYEYRTGKCLYEAIIDQDIILPIIEFLLTKDIHIDMFMGGGGKGYCPCKVREIIPKLDVEQPRKDYLLSNRVWLENPIEYIQEHGLTIQKITMNFYPDASGALVDRAEVKKFLENIPQVKVATSGWRNLEITAREVNKGQGIRFLCDKLGIPIESTMAMGDSLNDVDMVKTAGIGVAMGNAIPELKSVADEIARTNNECGVAQMILKHISSKNIRKE